MKEELVHARAPVCPLNVRSQSDFPSCWEPDTREIVEKTTDGVVYATLDYEYYAQPQAKAEVEALKEWMHNRETLVFKKVKPNSVPTEIHVMSISR